MDAARFKSNKTPVGSCVILLLSLLVLLTVPASVFAQDDNTIALLRKIGRTFASVAEKASPSVVVLTVDKPVPRGQLGTERRRIVIERDSRPSSIRTHKFGQKAKGLGFVVSDDGHILTCNYIVDGAKKIDAELADGREFEAKIVGTDPDTDIAVVKIDAKDLPALKLGDSDALEVGDWVIGMGNTMGLGLAFTRGLVTAKGRSLGMVSLEDLVQTSINLQVGDGGGPLLDLDGNVVGINFAFMGERSMGTSFAIPANMAKDIYEQLIKTGSVKRGFLGIALKDVDTKMAEALDLEKTEGVVITDIIEDSAAEKAGMKRYDVLVEFNGKPIESASRFILRVAVRKPGTQVDLVVLREEQRRNLTVTLGKRPSVQELKSDDAPEEP